MQPEPPQSAEPADESLQGPPPPPPGETPPPLPDHSLENEHEPPPLPPDPPAAAAALPDRGLDAPATSELHMHQQPQRPLDPADSRVDSQGSDTTNTAPMTIGATLVFSGALLALYSLCYWTILVLGAVSWTAAHPSASFWEGLRSISSKGWGLSSAYIFSGAVIIAAVYWIIRLRGSNFAQFLRLRRISARTELAWLGALVALHALFHLGLVAAGQPHVLPNVVEFYRASEVWLLIWIAFIGVLPIAEEILFRGFLFRGLETSRLGPIGAAVVTTLVFVAFHHPGEWVHLIWITLLGSLLGIARAQSGSLWIPILLRLCSDGFDIALLHAFARGWI